MADGDFDPGPAWIGRPLELGCGNDDKRGFLTRVAAAAWAGCRMAWTAHW